MSRTRLHVAFVGVVLATAAMSLMVGPDTTLSKAVVFLGFTLLYLSGLGAVSAAPTSDGRERPRRERETPRAEREQPHAQRERPRAEWERADPEAPARPIPEASRDADADAEVRSREESRWLDEQLSGDVDDIAFLPPYASDSQDGLVDEADDESGDWLPPGFAVEPPQPGEEAAEAVESYRNVPIPRHFALGTVAIIRDLMEPAQVAQILLEQRRQPKQQFGTLAVEMGFLDPEQLRELLVAQQEGLFTDEEIQSARSRLRAFRAAETPS